MTKVLEEPLVGVRSEESGQGWGQHGPQATWLADRQKIHEAAIKRYGACLGALIVFFILIHWARTAAVKLRWTRSRALTPLAAFSRFVH